MSRAIDHTKVAALIKGHGKRVRAAIGRGARRGAEHGRSIIVKKTPTDQGQLRNAWQVRQMPAGPGTVNTLAELVNEAPHAGIVEHGARPHPVSAEGMEALYHWVRRNRAEFGFLTKSGRTKKVTVDIEAELRKIAEGIAFKLRTKGQAPTYFVRNARPALTRAAVVEVKAAIAAEMARAG